MYIKSNESSHKNNARNSPPSATSDMVLFCITARCPTKLKTTNPDKIELPQQATTKRKGSLKKSYDISIILHSSLRYYNVLVAVYVELIITSESHENVTTYPKGI